MVEAPPFGVIQDWVEAARADLPLILSTQTPEGSYRFPSSCYESSNFMAGLLNDALLLYYEVIEPDNRIESAVRKSIDWLWATQWQSSKLTFNYYSGLCEGKGSTTPSPDLNGFFLEAWGWMYRRTGDQNFREQADLILQGGVQGAWLYGPKQFNEHYHHSWRYLWYR